MNLTFSFYVATKRYALKTTKDIKKVEQASLSPLVFIYTGSRNLEKDLKQYYMKNFPEDYYEKIERHKKMDLAISISIKIGNRNYWKEKSWEDRQVMKIVYQKCYKIFEKLINFDMIQGSLHLEQEVPYIKFIGISIKKNNRGEKRILKSSCFSLKELKNLREELKESTFQVFQERYPEEVIFFLPERINVQQLALF